MALKAGYKGFKKLKSPLKLFRPGELGIDQDALNTELNSVFFPRSEQAEFGATNVLNHSATSQTLNTCVITVDADDRTIDFNGTPTGGNASLQLITADQLNALLAKYGDLFLSGCPSGGAENKYSLFTRYGEDKFDRDTGNGVWLRASRTYDRPLYAQVIQGTVADHLVFKPMLSKSEYAPYAPFAKTNKELTDEAANISSGLIDALILQATYGSTNSINIDTIDNEKGYMYRVTTSTGFAGTAPGDLGNTFIILGLSKMVDGLPQYGVQIAIGIGSDKIAFRRAAYAAAGNAWPAWRYIDAPQANRELSKSEIDIVPEEAPATRSTKKTTKKTASADNNE